MPSLLHRKELAYLAEWAKRPSRPEFSGAGP